LNGFGPSDLVVSEIEDGGVGGDEDITQDVLGSDVGGEVEASESREAFGLAQRGDLEDVIGRLQGEGVSVDGNGDVREGVDDVAAGEDSFSVFDYGAQLGVQGVDFLGGADDEGSSGVADGLAFFGLAPVEAGSSEGEVVDFELPVGFGSEGGIHGRSGESGSINGAKSQFSSGGGSGILRQPEREDGLGYEALADQIVPDGSNVVNRDGVITESEDSVEFGDNKGESGFSGGFSEVLVLDLKASDGDGVLADEASQRSSSVLDRERSSVGHIGRRGFAVVFLVELASKISDGASLGRNPQVRGSSVEDNVEILGRSSNGDGSVVLSVVIVLEGDRSAAACEFRQKVSVRVFVILPGDDGAVEGDLESRNKLQAEESDDE